MDYAANFWPAFLMSLGAGLATGVGGLAAFLNHGRKSKGFMLSLGLGFSGGLMIYISLVELLGQGQRMLAEHYSGGAWYALLSFLGGVALAWTIDKLVPSAENPHEARRLDEFDHALEASAKERRELGRAGVLFALAIAIHNFPEGLATLIGGLDGTSTGLSIAAAIALHNIPEGVAIAIPLAYATGSRKKAFGYSVLAGLAEPLGALVGFAFLYPFLGPVLMAVLYAGVAGIMIYITFDELLPMAQRYGNNHITVWGIIGGMLVMASGMLIFG